MLYTYDNAHILDYINNYFKDFKMENFLLLLCLQKQVISLAYHVQTKHH